MSKSKNDLNGYEISEEEILYKPFLSRIFDFLIVLAIVALLAVIHIYNFIWKKENYFREESRYRMTALSKAEDFYKTLTGNYSEDLIHVMKVVNAIRDSATGDTTYLGEQLLKLGDEEIKVNVPQGFNEMFDTTFAFKWEVSDTVMDTTYKVVMYNMEQALFDTIYVLSQDLPKKSAEMNFRGVVDTSYSERVVNSVIYRPYLLYDSLSICPLLKKQYLVSADDAKRIEIRSPIKGEYRKRMFLFFSFQDTSHGAVINGEKNWEKI